MNNEVADRWKKKDLWSEREAAWICCGLDPHGANQNTAATNEAAEDLRRAVRAGVLDKIDHENPDPADHVYREAMYFKPRDVVAWAIDKGSPIPPAFRSWGQKPDVDPRERASMLKLIVVMATEKYEFKPSERHSRSPSLIQADLEKHGLELSVATIKKYLDEAAETHL